ncbi:MAG TPA: ERCC4 domain-containing protein [Candidatus Bathyarchaeia archaeon]|nr:ERCC4 domain-containing protein [Candidatus Bathyarchaeia archaeon]
MSSTETLLPFLKEPEREGKPKIIIDSREASASPKIAKGLIELGASVKTQMLSKGDYVISDTCAIERKTVHDFVYTLTHRYLFEQIYGLKDAYANPMILLEGYLPIIYKFSRINPTSVWGAIFALAKNGIAMIHTTSYKETIDFLYTAAKQEQLVEKRPLAVHMAKKLETLADSQIYFIASLPNIGREKASSILKIYGTPLNALINVEGWRKDVYGLGPIISEKAKQVLNAPFKE